MIYIKKIIQQDIDRTPTFNVESVRDFFKISLENGQHIIKRLILIPDNVEFDVRFQKRETRDEYRVFLGNLFEKIKPMEGDILIIRRGHRDIYSCEHIYSTHKSYEHLNHLFQENNNHQLVMQHFESDPRINVLDRIIVIDEFIDWFVKLDGIKHNYFSDSFSGDREKLKTELINYESIYQNDFKSNVFSVDRDRINQIIEEITLNLNKKEGHFYEFSSKKSNHMPRAILGKNNYLAFLK
jgi:hypothetical protein